MNNINTYITLKVALKPFINMFCSYLRPRE